MPRKKPQEGTAVYKSFVDRISGTLGRGGVGPGDYAVGGGAARLEQGLQRTRPPDVDIVFYDENAWRKASKALTKDFKIDIAHWVKVCV
jgi:hypothetical protein